MRASEGDLDWLRLFELMSAELAVAENCPAAPHLPPRDQRVKEIQELNCKLNAVNILEDLRYVVRYTDLPEESREEPGYYRIEYNNNLQTVTVTKYLNRVAGAIVYGKAEEGDNMSGENRLNTVLVEADKIESLKAAYPNYFGDVQLFSKNLQHITRGEVAQEYTMPPRQTYPPLTKEPPDMSWFRPGCHRRLKPLLLP